MIEDKQHSDLPWWVPVLVAVCIMTLAFSGVLLWLNHVNNRTNHAQDALIRNAATIANLKQAVRLSCGLANINRFVIRNNVAQNFADAVEFLQANPEGIPGLATKKTVLRNLDRLQIQYQRIAPVNCALFVRHPSLPPPFRTLKPLTASIGGQNK